ncbi:MAG: cyclohexyl-isocyanide hydratase [Thermoanaerobaculia bacterium]|jgi:cyclohexyl-isocyanide hydratase|nr:cyclohexyl-isocyanide hydratase [Thermoanaerobaculia bacterium]
MADADINIVIPIYEGFNILDVTGPIEIFNWVDGLQHHLAAETCAAVTSIEGVKVVPDYSFGDCPEFEVLWVPGGWPPYAPLQMPNYMNFVRERGARAQWVTSVCMGGLVLGASGLLDGYKATTHWAFLSCLALFPNVKVKPPKPHKKNQHYPRWVVDRNRVTGAGVSSCLDEALVLVSLLKGDLAAEQTQLTVQYAPDPPFHDGDPEEASRAIYEQAVNGGKSMLAKTSSVIEAMIGGT